MKISSLPSLLPTYLSAKTLTKLGAVYWEQVREQVTNGRWSTTTMISSIRHDGTTACLAIEGATNSEVFEAYAREILNPTLKFGDIVIMDNLSAHKRQTAIDLIKSTGAEVRFLPPYSPDLNPIEKMWSKVKEFQRSIKARTQEALYDAIANALKTVTPEDAIGWFESCGYATAKT